MDRRALLFLLLAFSLAPAANAHDGEVIERDPPQAPRERGGLRSGPEGGTAGTPGPAGAAREGYAGWWLSHRDRYLDWPAESPSDAAAEPAESAAEDPAIRRRARALAALRAAIDAKDDDLATSAIVAIGKAGDPADLPALLRVVGDAGRSRQARESALLAVGLLRAGADSRRRLVEFLRDGRQDPLERAAAALGLGLSSEPGALPALVAASRVHESRPDAPACSLVALGLLGDGIVVPELARALAGRGELRERDPLKRAAVAAALGRLPGGEARAALRIALRDGDREVRRQAVLSLAVAGPPPGEETGGALLVVLRSDRDDVARGYAAIALGELGVEAAADPILAVYHGASAKTTAFAASGLALLARGAPDRPVSNRIRSFLATELAGAASADAAGPLAIAAALARSEKAVPALGKLLRSGGPGIRAQAALALGMLGAREEAEELRATLRDATAGVLIRETGLALGLLGDAEGERILAGLAANGPTQNVRANACLALGYAGRLGGKGPGADTLISILADGDRPDPVRAAAAIGIGMVLERALRPVPRLATLDGMVSPTLPLESLRRALDVL